MIERGRHRQQAARNTPNPDNTKDEQTLPLVAEHSWISYNMSLCRAPS